MRFLVCRRLRLFDQSMTSLLFMIVKLNMNGDEGKDAREHQLMLWKGSVRRTQQTKTHAESNLTRAL